MILLCNHKRTEFGKPHAYRGPMCVDPVTECVLIQFTGRRTDLEHRQRCLWRPVGGGLGGWVDGRSHCLDSLQTRGETRSSASKETRLAHSTASWWLQLANQHRDHSRNCLVARNLKDSTSIPSAVLPGLSNQSSECINHSTSVLHVLPISFLLHFHSIIETRWDKWMFFNLTNPSSRTGPWGSLNL
jgi:hypothetical protein